MSNDDTHLISGLDRSLHSVRHFVLAKVVHVLIKMGVFQRFRDGIRLSYMTNNHGYDPRVISAVFLYLTNEGLIEKDSSDNYRMTPAGNEYLTYAGWLKLFVGGYDPVLSNLDMLIKSGVSGELRNLSDVASGSGDISCFDAAPLVLSLLRLAIRPCKTILDIGCGDAQLLCEVVANTPGSTGIGCDPSFDSINMASVQLSKRNLGKRIELCISAGDDILSIPHAPDLIIAAFSLQEVLGRYGEDHLISWMIRLREKWREAYWIVVEPDFQPNALRFKGAYGLGYYNPYYLFHSLTEQKLLPRDEWIRLFERSGFEVLQVLSADERVDPTGYELGYLLQNAQVAPSITLSSLCESDSKGTRRR